MADWSPEEVEWIIADYFSMLDKELAGQPYSKTEHRNRLLTLLPRRNKSAVEFKHQNISAVLAEMGLPFIEGYKPAYNYQRSLLPQRVFDYLQRHQLQIEPGMASFADESVSFAHHESSLADPAVLEELGVAIVTTNNFDRLQADPPERNQKNKPTKTDRVRSPFKINYLEREQRNAGIGAAGERLALDYERWRLHQAGLYTLAESVEWISQHDDGAGFDILSRNANGTDRYIEVKSTKLSKDTPIFFSQTEYQFSLQHAADYHLYRFFHLKQHPQFFTLHGDFDALCRKEPIQYKGFF